MNAVLSSISSCSKNKDKPKRLAKSTGRCIAWSFVIWLIAAGSSLASPPELSDISIELEKTAAGHRVVCSCVVTLTKAIAPADQNVWTTVLVYPEEDAAAPESGRKVQYVARSSFPMNVSLQGTKPIGKTIPITLAVREDQVGELPAGAYAVYAFGYGPGTFKERLGSFSVSIDAATHKRNVVIDSVVSSRQGKASDVATEDNPKGFPWFPFHPPELNPSGTAIDMSRLLDRPAGKHGFVKTDNGHFVFDDGVRARFWGVVVGAPNVFQDHKASERLARRLAALGCNLVRIHNIAAAWAMPNILHFSYLEKNSNPSPEHLSEKSLDRLDYFIYQLKRRGIYVYLDLYADPANYKNAPFFNSEIIVRKKRLNRELLTHFNPYTQTAYCDEPAIMAMLIVNEDSLFFQPYYQYMPAEYREELQRLWNGWLQKKYGSRQQLVQEWSTFDAGCTIGSEEDPGNDTVAWPQQFNLKNASQSDRCRVRDWNLFLYELQSRYFRNMELFLRTVGVKVPITGSNQHVGCAGDILSNVSLKMGFFDQHWYWDHPQAGLPGAVRGVGAKITNKAMVQSMGQNDTITWLGRMRVHQKPFMVSEWNNCRPNEYRVEGPLMMAGYAMLQDWDALMQLAFNRAAWQPQMDAGNFDFSVDPSMLGLWPAIALMFHRQDVGVAEQEYIYNVPKESLWSAQALRWDIPAPAPLIGRVSTRFGTGRAGLEPEIPKTGKNEVKKSDTGELAWDTVEGIFSVDTERTQGVTGFLDGKTAALKNVVIKPENNFCTIILSALDNKPIADSRHLLLTAVARCENAGTLQNTDKTILLDGGEAPIVIEPVSAEVSITFNSSAGNAKVYALDCNGHRKKEITADRADNVLDFATSAEYETIYYEIDNSN